MNKLFLIIFCYFLITSCQNVPNSENINKKSLDKEFTISSDVKLKNNK